jgi:hypothetical protein
MFWMIRRLANRSRNVELLIFWFDTHLRPNVANLAYRGSVARDAGACVTHIRRERDAPPRKNNQ